MDEVFKRTVDSWLLNVCPDDRELVAAYIEKAFLSGKLAGVMEMAAAEAVTQ